MDAADRGGLQLVVFILEGRRHAVALLSVERVLPMVAIAPLPDAPAIALGVIDVRGAVVPVFDLRVRFALPPRDYGLDARLVLVRTPRRQVALAADAVPGVIEIPAGGLTPAASVPGVRGLAGVAALPDGLVFSHDLEALLSVDEERRLGQALAATTR